MTDQQLTPEQEAALAEELPQLKRHSITIYLMQQRPEWNLFEVDMCGVFRFQHRELRRGEVSVQDFLVVPLQPRYEQNKGHVYIVAAINFFASLCANWNLTDTMPMLNMEAPERQYEFKEPVPIIEPALEP